MRLAHLGPKSLRSRIAWSVTFLVFCSLLIGGSAVIGIMSLHRNAGVAAVGYRQLRAIFEAGHHITSARDASIASPVDREKAKADLDAANVSLSASPEIDHVTRATIVAMLDGASRDPGGAATLLNRALSELAGASGRVRQSIETHEAAIARDRKAAMLHVCIFSGAVVLLGGIVGAGLYRSVMRQIKELSAGVREFASRRLGSRLPVTGDRELAALAADFNFMAQELSALYERLEERVQTKSRQLVQSERLASLGYLAAGVAHEINNPLGIIAGYGERAQRRLSDPVNESAVPQVRDDLAVMCDEAFRCKQITDRLLMLARNGDEQKRPIEARPITEEVVTSVGALNLLADRRLTLEAPHNDDLNVLANEGQLRQLILNLVINALEATAPKIGHVHVAISRAGGEVELAIADNGRGMMPDMLEKIFEPFFTDKRGQRPGTGLGLSVVHAIVQDHGGTIEAHSDGLGAGSRFVVRLPCAAREECHAAG